MEWGVHFCIDCPPSDKYHAAMIRNRLVVPVFWMGKLVGWQTRAIDRSMPKYYTMPGLKKTQMFFNGDRARGAKFGVVVEGVFDAFRLGPKHSVALLGQEVSAKQRELALAFWSTGALCVILDPEALEDLKRVERINIMLNPDNFRWGVFSLALPSGSDPASTDRQALWDMITNFARTRNIPLATL